MSRQNCYCAFCKTPRKVYTRRRIGLSHILAAALGAGLAMMALFQEFDPRVFLLFILFLAISEIFVQLRWRLTLVCKECGFDPVLYLKNHELAAEKVKFHLEQRKRDPASLLKPPLQIPKISKEKAEQLREEATAAATKQRGSLVNRQI
jgi:hypothetical protein